MSFSSASNSSSSTLVANPHPYETSTLLLNHHGMGNPDAASNLLIMSQPHPHLLASGKHATAFFQQPQHMTTTAKMDFLQATWQQVQAMEEHIALMVTTHDTTTTTTTTTTVEALYGAVVMAKQLLQQLVQDHGRMDGGETITPMDADDTTFTWMALQDTLCFLQTHYASMA